MIGQPAGPRPQRSRPRRSRATAALATFVVGSLATACGGSSKSSSSSASSAVQLTMWQQWGGGHQQEALDAAIKQYETLHPKVTITETPVTNHAKILAAITGGNPPDGVDLGTSLPLGGWASQGAVQSLD